jgi:hypothetical protein
LTRLDWARHEVVFVNTYVLNIEGAPNWEADRSSGFSHLGLSDRRKKFFDSLEVGDKIITYVKATGFVDVREVAAKGTAKLGMKGNYPDGAWPWQIKTRLVASVGLGSAISPNRFPLTKLCSGQWRYRFQQSGKRVDAADGDVIARAIIDAARKPTL